MAPARFQFSLADIFVAVALVALGFAILVWAPPRMNSGCLFRPNVQLYPVGVFWGMAAGILTKHRVAWVFSGFVASLIVGNML